MGHAQPWTPIQTNNSTAHGVLTNIILPNALKAMNMRLHWLQCRNAQGQFRYYWRPGPSNKADYWTKHHPPVHHASICPEILTSQDYLENFRKAKALALARQNAFTLQTLTNTLKSAANFSATSATKLGLLARVC